MGKFIDHGPVDLEGPREAGGEGDEAAGADELRRREH